MMMGFGGYPMYNGMPTRYANTNGMMGGYGSGTLPQADPVVALTNGAAVEGNATPATQAGHTPVGEPAKPGTAKKIATGAKQAMGASVRKTKQEVGEFFSPNQQGQPWYKDKQKLTISGLGIVTVGLLGLGLSGGGIARREARTPTEWFHNIFHGRAFKDQHQWLMDEMGRGFKGFGGRKRKRNLKNRMEHNGSTLYLQGLVKQLQDHNANLGAVYTNSFGPKEQALKEASDVWLLHKELLKKPNAYKEFGFSSQSEAIQQTHAVMNIHLNTLKKDLTGILGLVSHGAEGKEKRALINGYETLSEKFLDDYLKRHVKDPTKHPVGQGAVELGKQVYLRNTEQLLKQGREKEALEKIRNFTKLASGQGLPNKGGAESPKRLFTDAEWKQFMGHYAQLFDDLKHPMFGAPKNQPSISQLMHQFKRHSIQVAKGNPEAKHLLKETILQLNREAGTTFSGDAMVRELTETIGHTPGYTFNFMRDMLKKYKPTPPILYSMETP
jgi:hypothetical protein